MNTIKLKKNINLLLVAVLLGAFSHCANLSDETVETAGSTIVPVSVGGATEVPVDPNQIAISLANDSLGQALVGVPFSLTLQSDLRKGGNTMESVSCGNPSNCRDYACSTLPTGLSLSTTDGIISGTITAAVGNYSIVCSVASSGVAIGAFAERTLSLEVTQKYSEVKHDCGNLLIDTEISENTHSNDTSNLPFSTNHSKIDAVQGTDDNDGICEATDNKWNLNIGVTREAYWDDGGAGAIDRDPYRIVVSHTGNYTFDVKYVDKEHPDRQLLLYEKRFDPKITLYNSYYVQFYQEDKNLDFLGEKFTYTLAPGTYYIVVSDLDGDNGSNADQGVYSISVKEVFANDPVVNIDTVTLNNATARVAFSQTLAFSGITNPNFQLFSGALPDGLSLNTSTGEISGTPTLFAYGYYTFALELRNSDNQFEVEYKNFSMLVHNNHFCGTLTTDPEYSVENDRMNESVSVLVGLENADKTTIPTACNGGTPAANKWRLAEGTVRNVSLTDNSGDDLDYFQIEITTSGTYKFDVIDVSDSPWYVFVADPRSDYQLALMTPLDKEIKKVDVAGNGGNETMSLYLARGTYYIKVWPNFPNAAYDKSSYYSIQYNKQ